MNLKRVAELRSLFYTTEAWCLTHDTDRDRVSVVCGNGHISHITGTGRSDGDWTITRQGVVAPSILCHGGQDGCGWHHFVTLDDYTP
jgi:hypothetical protein